MVDIYICINHNIDLYNGFLFEYNKLFHQFKKQKDNKAFSL